MTTRTLAGILLFCGDELLMMKRNEGRRLSPGLWANIGGHVEQHEMAFPAQAALRELKEETDIASDQITGFFPRYIVVQKVQSELRVFYDFTAFCKERPPLPENEEGELHWVKTSEVLSLPMPVSLHLLLQHYFTQPFEKKTVLGIMEEKDGVVTATWHTL